MYRPAPVSLVLTTDVPTHLNSTQLALELAVKVIAVSVSAVDWLLHLRYGGAEYCDERVCLCVYVCMSEIIS